MRIEPVIKIAKAIKRIEDNRILSSCLKGFYHQFANIWKIKNSRQIQAVGVEIIK